MKIRTDFVTNSSSYSSAEIVIDNPLLLDILQKYKEMGAFAVDELLFDIGSYGEDDQSDEDGPATPAFHYSGDDNPSQCPESMDDVLKYLIEVMYTLMNEVSMEKYKNKYFDQLKKELIKNKEEINKEFRSIAWKTRFETNDSDEDWDEDEELDEEDEEKYYGFIYETMKFNYDPETGIETLYLEENEEGEVLTKYHEINGEKVE